MAITDPERLAEDLYELGLWGDVQIHVATSLAERIVRQVPGIAAQGADDLDGLLTEVADLVIEWVHDPGLPADCLAFDDDGYLTIINVTTALTV